MCRCEDEQRCRCADVKMWRCRWDVVVQTLFYEEPFADALGKKQKHLVKMDTQKKTVCRNLGENTIQQANNVKKCISTHGLLRAGTGYRLCPVVQENNESWTCSCHGIVKKQHTHILFSSVKSWLLWCGRGSCNGFCNLWTQTMASSMCPDGWRYSANLSRLDVGKMRSWPVFALWSDPRRGVRYPVFSGLKPSVLRGSLVRCNSCNYESLVSRVRATLQGFVGFVVSRTVELWWKLVRTCQSPQSPFEVLLQSWSIEAPNIYLDDFLSRLWRSNTACASPWLWGWLTRNCSAAGRSGISWSTDEKACEVRGFDIFWYVFTILLKLFFFFFFFFFFCSYCPVQIRKFDIVGCMSCKRCRRVRNSSIDGA